MPWSPRRPPERGNQSRVPTASRSPKNPEPQLFGDRQDRHRLHRILPSVRTPSSSTSSSGRLHRPRAVPLRRAHLCERLPRSIPFPISPEPRLHLPVPPVRHGCHGCTQAGHVLASSCSLPHSAHTLAHTPAHPPHPLHSLSRARPKGTCCSPIVALAFVSESLKLLF